MKSKLKTKFKKIIKFAKDNVPTVVAFTVFFVLFGLKLTHHLPLIHWWMISIPLWVEIMTRMF